MFFNPPFPQQSDINGRPLRGWLIEFFEDDSAAPRAAYQDAAYTKRHATPIEADAFGRCPPIFLVPSLLPFRCVVTYPDGRKNEVKGLLTEPPTTNTTPNGQPLISSVGKSGTSVTIDPEDFGRIVSVASSGSTPIAVALPDTAGIGAGQQITIRNDGTGTLALQPIAGDTIDTTSLTRPGQSVTLVTVVGGYVSTAQANPADSGGVATRPVPTLVVLQAHPSATSSLSASGFATAPPAGAWTPNPFNTLDFNSIAGASLNAAGRVVLPAGSYRVQARRRIRGPIAAVLEVRSLNSAVAVRGTPEPFSSLTARNIELDKCFTLAATETLELRWLLEGTPDAFTLGEAAAITTIPEVYARAVFERIT